MTISATATNFTITGPDTGTFLPEIAHLSMDIHFDYQ